MRDLTPDMVTAFEGREVSPALLAELYFDSATIYLWSGIGNLEWNAKTYTGGGSLVGISSIDETQDLSAKGIVATLSGIPSTLVSATLTERTRGRPFKLYLGVVSTTRTVLTEGGDTVLSEDGGSILLESQLVDTPYRIFTGMMDVIELFDNGENSTARLSVESSLITGERNKLRRYTDADQKLDYPSDKGLEFINQLQDKEIVW